MNRRSSRSSSNLSQIYTANPVSADISLVFADSIQIGTSPGVAAATLPRLSVPQAKNSLLDRDKSERDIAKDNSSSRFVPRSNRSLLSSMYLSKWRQHPTAIPRTERVIQPGICSSPELSHVTSSDNKTNSTPDTCIPDTCSNPSCLPMTRPTSPSPQASRLDTKPETSLAMESLPGTDSAGLITTNMCFKDAEVYRVPTNSFVSTNPGPDYPECSDIPASKTVEPDKAKADPTNDVLQQSDSSPYQTHDNRILSGTSSIADPVIESDSSSFRLSMYVPSSFLPRPFFSSASKKEIQCIDDPVKESTSASIHYNTSGAALDLPSERSQDGTSIKASPIEKASGSPSSAWSDYLKLTTATVPKSSLSTSDSISPSTPPRPKDESDIQVISHAPPSSTSNHSWFAPWAWWHLNSGLDLSSESIAAPTDPERNFKDSRTQSIGTKSLSISSELANPIPIGADRGTRVGWLSVLTTTNARQRALKEEGEIMEVMTVPEESSSIKPARSDDINIQPESRSGVSMSKSVISKDSTFVSSSKKSLPPPHLPNLVLPTFEDAFCNPPRSNPLPKEESTLHRTVNYVAKMLFHDDATVKEKGKGKEPFGRDLPKAWIVLGEEPKKVLEKIKRVVVIGIHGWFPRAFVRQVLGEPTGTSEKFATMLERTVEEFFAEYGVTLDKVTKIVLQGEGTVAQRVNNLFQEYLNREDWVNDLQTADAILFGTHSQGSIVTTELVNRLINEGHIRTPNSSLLSSVSMPQRVGVLAICGVHNGPLLYLNTSSFVNPYIQYFESAAARELFEFQDSESPASKNYIAALSNCLNHGVKFTYIASLDDQVVPIYSGAFVNATHPLILRALYIDGDAYHSSDFLSNLLVLLFKIRNTGLHDSGLIAHLSEATAGSLTGLGHSTAYEEPASYKLAVRFLFETSDVIGSNHDLIVEPFTARAARNDYEIPWALRDLIANPDVAALFASEFSSLRSAFDDWHPRTTVLRDIRRKLEPIRRLNTSKL